MYKDGLLALKRRLEDQFSTYVYGACVWKTWNWSARSLIHGKEEYISKKLGKLVNMKKNVKRYLSFSFTYVNNLSFCALDKRTFSKTNVVLVMLHHNLGSNHSGFKEKEWNILHVELTLTNS